MMPIVILSVVISFSLAQRNTFYKRKALGSCEEAIFYTNSSGPYVIKVPDSGVEKFHVYCEVDPNGGIPWTVIQRNRDDTHINFTKNWHDYSYGFGDINTEFFVGLVYLHALTASEPHELWVRLEDFSNQKYNAHYNSFVIGNEKQRFTLSLLGDFTGDIHNSLDYNRGQSFSTYDSDNDNWTLGNCALNLQGGWWFVNCGNSNLNGRHHRDHIKSGIIWGIEKEHVENHQTHRHRTSIMAIRPLSEF